jgi:hypothetical protein
MLLKFYIILSSILTTSNVKIQNYKVVDLIECYNFDVKKYLHLTLYRKDIIFLMPRALGCNYYYPEILYYLFEHLNALK